jgi:hypothetical protein
VPFFFKKKCTSLKRLLQDRTNQDSRPSNVLFQITRGSGATLSERTKCSSLMRLLQDMITLRLHAKRTWTKLDSTGKAGETRRPLSSTMKCSGLVDAGPTGFRSSVTIGHGPWPGLRAEARRDAASATPTPSRIGQTSRIPMESTFCI